MAEDEEKREGFSIIPFPIFNFFGGWRGAEIRFQVPHECVTGGSTYAE
jgi:hypothetical protein